MAFIALRNDPSLCCAGLGRSRVEKELEFEKEEDALGRDCYWWLHLIVSRLLA